MRSSASRKSHRTFSGAPPSALTPKGRSAGLSLDGFSYRQGRLHAEDVPIERIAEDVGTPVYVYSAAAIRRAYQRMQRAFAPIGARLHYAVKASPNLQLCRLMHELGAGMDVVSGGEMERAWLAGSPMADMVFAGVGKTEAEVRVRRSMADSARWRAKKLDSVAMPPATVGRWGCSMSSPSPSSSASPRSLGSSGSRRELASGSTPTSTPRPSNTPPPVSKRT